MEIALFKISSYLRPGEATHVARKELADRWPAAAHRHDYFEVFLIEKGATEHWINGQREILSKGHVVFIRPDDAHAFCANPEEGCGIVNVMVRADTATHLKQRYPEEFRGRFFDNPARGPDTYFLQGPRMERAINVAQDLANSKLTLARVEEFLLTLANRVIDPVHRLNSAAPRWLIDACAAARSPEVFRAGAAGFVAAAGRSHEHVCRTCRDVLGDLTIDLHQPPAYRTRRRSARPNHDRDTGHRCRLRNREHQPFLSSVRQSLRNHTARLPVKAPTEPV